MTVSEIKEIKVSGYKTDMDKITVKVPMAALPESGTTVAVIIRVKTPNGKIVNLPLAGVVVEETVVVNGVARKVRKVQLELMPPHDQPAGRQGLHCSCDPEVKTERLVLRRSLPKKRTPHFSRRKPRDFKGATKCSEIL